MAAVTICSDFGAQKNKVWHCFPIYLSWSDGTRCHNLSFLGREHSSTHQQKIGLKIYWAWPCPSGQDPVSPSVSLTHQEASTSLYPSPSEGRQDENHNHRKLTNLITGTTALSSSKKLWAMLCRPTQDGRVMVESSGKMWSPGEGSGKPHQHSHLTNCMNSMERQKDMTLKDEPLRSVGIQHATGKERRNSFRKITEAEPVLRKTILHRNL